MSTLWQCYPTSRPKYNQNLTLLQRRVPAGFGRLLLNITGMNHSDSHWFQFTLLERSVCQDSNNKIVLHKNDIRIVFNLNRGPNRFSGMLELTLLLLGFGNYRFYVSIFYFYWVKLWIMIFFWCENVKKLLSALNTFVLPLSVSENLVSFSFLDHKNYIFFFFSWTAFQMLCNDSFQGGCWTCY